MSYRDELGQGRLDLARCGYVGEDAGGWACECILRADHPGRHVLLRAGYVTRPVRTVELRGEVL